MQETAEGTAVVEVESTAVVGVGSTAVVARVADWALVAANLEQELRCKGDCNSCCC
jgi:hypothetical protein